MSNKVSRRSVIALAASAVRGNASAPLFEQTDLFRQGEGGVHTYRIPALIETGKGTLVAIADARHDGTQDLPARISLVCRRSVDKGRTWSATRTILAPASGGVGDASLLLDGTSGRIWCFHAYGPPGIGTLTAKAGTRTGPDTLQVHAMSSTDDGETWSQPIDLTPQIKEPRWHAMFATSGTHYQTSRRRLLVPMVVRDEAKQMTSRNAYSDDGGKSWRMGNAIAEATDESKAVELADGSILQNMRNGKLRAIARSRDGGVTFEPVSHDAALIDPSCNAGLMRYRRRGVDLLVFTNAASTKRENLTIRLSSDGKTWSESRVIHAGPAAYSTVIQLRDGSIGVLYERGEKSSVERITFARLSLEWIRRGPNSGSISAG